MTHEAHAARRPGLTVVLRASAILSIVAAISGCGGAGSEPSDAPPSAADETTSAAPLPPATPAEPAPADPRAVQAEKASVGALVFSDRTLSANGNVSCATCHVPSRAFAPGIDHLFGGPLTTLLGTRNAPTLTYQHLTPSYRTAADGEPVGGFMLDGRAPTLEAQAVAPLFSPLEMGLADAETLRAKIAARPYAGRLRELFGADVLADAQSALHAVGAVLSAFQSNEAIFSPFSSKYDAYLQGRVTLADSELRGLRLFEDPGKGNCAACHPSRPTAQAPRPLFTDFRYANLGVPRNWRIRHNDDAALASLPPPPNDGLSVLRADQIGPAPYRHYDLGLCGPGAPLQGSLRACGAFKTPTLRNAAVKYGFMHNTYFLSLRDAIAWLVGRDVDPARWYLKADRVTPDAPYNDLPPSLRAQVLSSVAPFGARPQPALTDAEIDDVVAFLCTLVDGFDAAAPGRQVLPGQCTRAGTP